MGEEEPVLLPTTDELEFWFDEELDENKPQPLSLLQNEDVTPESSEAGSHLNSPDYKEDKNSKSVTSIYSETEIEIDDETLTKEAFFEYIKKGDEDWLDSFIDETSCEDLEKYCSLSGEGGCIAVTLAAREGHLDVIEKLGHAGIWLFQEDKSGYYAIHRAALNNRVNVVHFLAKLGQFYLKTPNGYTALHLAAQEGHTEVLEALLPYVCMSLDPEAPIETTPLHLACQNGHLSSVEFLVLQGAEVNKRQNETSCLHFAVKGNHLAVAKCLLDHGADVNAVNKNGDSVLNMAVKYNRVDHVSLLLSEGAAASIDIHNKWFWFPLLRAIAKNYEELVELLLEHGADVNKVAKGPNCLSVACTSGNQSLVKRLLEVVADVNIQEEKKLYTPLYYAVMGGYTEIVQLLIGAGADVNINDHRGMTPLHVACRNGHSEIVPLLLDGDCNVNKAASNGWTPLHYACHNPANISVVQDLLKAGGDCFVLGSAMLMPVNIAILKRNKHLLKTLITNSMSIYKLANCCNTDELMYLQSCGVDLNLQNFSGCTALHHAALEGNLDAVERLLLVKVDVHSRTHDGNMPIHLAASCGHTPIVKFLLHKHAFMNLCNKNGEDCLYLATQGGHEDTVELLLSHGASINAQHTDERNTCLFAAAQNNLVDMVQLLLAYGARVKMTNEFGLTPLHVAAQLGHDVIITYLVKSGADVDCVTPQFETPLHLAAGNGQLGAVLELILARANLNMEDEAGNRPIHAAARKGFTSIVEVLLEGGSQVSLLNGNGDVSYDLAKHVEIWNLIKRWALRQSSFSEISGQRMTPLTSPGLDMYSEPPETPLFTLNPTWL